MSIQDRIQAGLKQIVDGKRYIFFGDGFFSSAETLVQLGAACLVITSNDARNARETNIRIAHVRNADYQHGDTARNHMLALDRSLRTGHATSVEQQLQIFDPDYSARVVVPPAIVELNTFASRRAIGSRPWTWEAAEAKTIGRQIVETAALPHPEGYVIETSDPDLTIARYSTIWRSSGKTVWAGDARAGRIGTSGRDVTIVHDRDQALRLLRQSVGQHQRMLISPFVSGTPGSVHGMVFSSGAVATFPPLELLNLVSAESPQKFRTCGYSTAPYMPAKLDHQGRMDVTSAGLLMGHHGFRGGFSLDRIVNADEAVLYHEANLRFTGGLFFMADVVPEIALPFINALLVEGDLSEGKSDLINAFEVGAFVSERVSRRPDISRVHIKVNHAVDIRQDVSFRNGAWTRGLHAHCPQAEVNSLTVGDSHFVLIQLDPRTTSAISAGPLIAKLARSLEPQIGSAARLVAPTDDEMSKIPLLESDNGAISAAII